ncbi:MAG: hypothetical protein QNL43_10305 [Crocinitomicaceae bacterium]|jgi:hypothetical protein|tara:strand:+ start:998 stop:1534 length:537 start_codon:yes stop_codon:yes gene_type:complete
MFSTLIKKKLSDNQVANIFINAIFDSVDKGFLEIASLINEDPVFVTSPKIEPTASGEFGMVIIVGNLSFLESTFDADQASRVESLIFQKLAVIYDLEENEFVKLIRNYQSFISRVNHPSKNWIYGMSKAIFHKYKLNEFQDEYFKRMRAPNPLFLKRMDEVVANYIWNWDAFFKKYRL